MLARRSFASPCSARRPCSRMFRNQSYSCPVIVPKKGPDRARFVAGFSRDRLENLVMEFQADNSRERCQRDSLRFRLRKLMGRYLHMKLHRSGLMCLSPSAAKQTVEQLSGAQQHRVHELENEQQELMLRANTLVLQLRVTRNVADQICYTVEAPLREHEMCDMTLRLLNDMKNEAARLREAVEKKRRELVKLRRHLAKGRCIARDVQDMVRGFSKSVRDDVRAIRWRRGVMVRDSERYIEKEADIVSDPPYRPLAPWGNLLYID